MQLVYILCSTARSRQSTSCVICLSVPLVMYFAHFVGGNRQTSMDLRCTERSSFSASVQSWSTYTRSYFLFSCNSLESRKHGYDISSWFTTFYLARSSPGGIPHFDYFYRADSLPSSPQKATACTLVTVNRFSLGVYQAKCKPGATTHREHLFLLKVRDSAREFIPTFVKPFTKRQGRKNIDHSVCHGFKTELIEGEWCPIDTQPRKWAPRGRA